MGVVSIRNAKDVDTLLAKDLNQLSIEERDDLYEGIHGVNATIEETPELVISSCVQLQIAIDLIEDKPAYDMALEKNDEFVRSEKFQLMFLRCDDFDIPKTAHRIVAYHTKMLEYFGPQVLGRPLYYTDLTKEAQAYLETGIVQFVQPKCRDSTGRAIFIENYLQAEKVAKSTLTMVQTFIYVWYCAIENDDLTQKRGIVGISYIVGKLSNKNDFDSDAYNQVTDMKFWMPMKPHAHHICFHNPIWHFFVPLAWIAMGQEMRRRVRIHDGTHLEVYYALQSFGIPVDQLPVDFNGNVQLKSHLKWLQHRQEMEEAMKSSTQPLDVIVKPSPADVALWRGRIYQLHPGNVRMRQLIETHRQEYDSAPKGTKAEIAMKVVQEIQNEDCGRFLTQHENGYYWIVVTDKEAQRKVSKAFRSARAATATGSVTSNLTASTTTTNNEKLSSMSTTTTNSSSDMKVGDGYTFHEKKHNNKRLRIESTSGSLLHSGFEQECCIFRPLGAQPISKDDFQW